MNRYICTHEDVDHIDEYGEGPTIEDAKNLFFDQIELNEDYPIGFNIEWEVFERVLLKDNLCNNLRGVYLDGILEDLLEECAFEDIWPNKKQCDKLESLLIGTIKNWVRNNPEFDHKWQCGDLIDAGVYVKQGGEG